MVGWREGQGRRGEAWRQGGVRRGTDVQGELAQVVLVAGCEGVELEEDLCDFGPFVVGVHARHVDRGEAEAVLGLNNCSVLFKKEKRSFRNPYWLPSDKAC